MFKEIFKTIFPTIVLGAVLSACTMYSSKPGKKSDIVGTYELTTITKKDENDEKYDYKAQIGAQAYFSIDENGYGYYGYKDNETPAHVEQVFSTFIQDDENEELYKAIELTDGITNVSTYLKEVGCMDEPKMGFNVDSKTLSYTIPYQAKGGLVAHEVQYQYVSYKRISKTASLDEVNAKLGTSATFDRPFELKKMDGFYVGYFGTCEEQPNEDYGKYEYVILDMDSYENDQVDAYYSLASEPGKVSVKAPITIKEGNGVYRVPVLHLFEKEFDADCWGSQLPTSFSRMISSEPDEAGTAYLLYTEYFSKYYTNATTVDELIQELLNK